MRVEDQATALWQTLEVCGIKPSIASVTKALRLFGVTFKNEVVRDALRSLAQKGEDGASAGPAFLAQRASEGPAGGEATHTRAVTVSGNLDEETSSSSSSVPSDSSESGQPVLTLVPVPAKPKAVRQPRLDTRTAAQKTADEAIAQLREEISGAIAQTMTWTDWVRRNRRAVTAMAQAGLDVDAILEAHREASEARGSTAVVMHWVHDRLIQQAGKAVTRDRGRELVDNLQSASELGLGTKPDEIPPWERPPGHPLFQPRPTV